MNRNSKIFIGLAIFLFGCAFSFKFTFGKDTSFELMWADMLPLMVGFLAAAVAMIILFQKTKKEEHFEDDQLKLKELSRSSFDEIDSDEFV